MKRSTPMASRPSLAAGARACAVGLALVVALLVLLPAGPARAEAVVVTLNSGQTLTGEKVRETDAQLVLRDEAGRTRTLAKSDIASVAPRLSPQQEYAQRSAQLAPEDLDGRWTLAYDMHERGANDLALRELEALARRFPQGENARHDRIYFLLQTVRNEIARSQPRDRGEDAAAAESRRTTGSQAPAVVGNRVLTPAEPQRLSRDQINLLKVWELPIDLENARVTVRVSRDVLEKVLEDYQRELPQEYRGRRGRADFLRLRGWQHAQMLFDLEARPYYGDIEVIRGPETLQTFQNRIHPGHVLRYFAPRFASGQTGLFLFGPGPGASPESVAMSNFLILSQAEAAGGRFIDRDNPAQSLLVQWSLPREVADIPAPQVPAWAPAFDSLDDPECQNLIRWIGALYAPMPDYGIDYAVPVYKQQAPPAGPSPPGN
ncbi:MAG: hypothetical protein AAF612_01765 [Planctomycetota bacterium]